MPEKPRDPQEPADTLELLDDDASAGGRPQKSAIRRSTSRWIGCEGWQ